MSDFLQMNDRPRANPVRAIPRNERDDVSSEFAVRLGLACVLGVLALVIVMMVGIVLSAVTSLLYSDFWWDEFAGLEILVEFIVLGLLIGMGVGLHVLVPRRQTGVIAALLVWIVGVIAYFPINLWWWEWEMEIGVIFYTLAMAAPLGAIVLVDRLVGGWTGLGVGLVAGLVIGAVGMTAASISIDGGFEFYDVHDVIYFMEYMLYDWTFTMTLLTTYGLVRSAEWVGLKVAGKGSG